METHKVGIHFQKLDNIVSVSVRGRMRITGNEALNHVLGWRSVKTVPNSARLISAELNSLLGVANQRRPEMEWRV